MLIDLSHSFTAKMPVYPGDEPPVLKETSRVETTGVCHYELRSGFHVGTHIDAPCHMIADAKKLSEFPLDHFTGRGVLLDARGKNELTVDLLKGVELQTGDCVLICTGFSQYFNEARYFTNFPVLSPDFAEALTRAKIKLMGTDTPSPDREPYAIHRILLSQDVLILENLCKLEVLLGTASFRVVAFPPKFEADGSFVRVVAEL